MNLYFYLWREIDPIDGRINSGFGPAWNISRLQHFSGMVHNVPKYQNRPRIAGFNRSFGKISNRKQRKRVSTLWHRVTASFCAAPLFRWSLRSKSIEDQTWFLFFNTDVLRLKRKICKSETLKSKLKQRNFMMQCTSFYLYILRKIIQIFRNTLFIRHIDRFDHFGSSNVKIS